MRTDRRRDSVREIVSDLNARIVAVNSSTVSGPASTIMPPDFERVVERWRARSTTN